MGEGAASVSSMIKVVKGVVLVGQLGFYLVTPPVCLALLASWLQGRFGWGAWVMVTAIVVGLLSSGMGAYNFYRRLTASEAKRKKPPEETPIVFYRHE